MVSYNMVGWSNVMIFDGRVEMKGIRLDWMENDRWCRGEEG